MRSRSRTRARASTSAPASARSSCIKEHVRSTLRPEVVGDIGGFGGLFAFEPRGMRDPILVSSTDGVGTKSLIARLMGKYDTIGIDLVAGSVDDIAVQGAEPLFFLDYISTGKLVEEIVADIVAGVAHGCRTAGCALLGGEMSEHDIMEPGEFDLVGFAVGVVERARILPAGVRAGDVVVGFASPGLRQNGYTLARKALLERAGRRLDDPAWRGAHHTLGDELLRPSVIYAPAMRKLRERVPGARLRAHHRRRDPREPRACARTALRRASSPAARGTSRASSARSRPPAPSRTTRWSRSSTSASACWRSSRRRTDWIPWMPYVPLGTMRGWSGRLSKGGGG